MNLNIALRRIFNPNPLSKGATAMRNFNSLAVTVLTAFTIVSAVACGGNDLTGTTVADGPLEGRLVYTSDCQLDMGAPDFCSNRIDIPVSFKEGLNNKGAPTVHEDVMQFSRDDASNSADVTVEIPDSVWEENEYVTAYFDLESVNLGEDYEFQLCGGGDPTSKEMVGGSDFCLRIVKRGSTGDTGDTDGGTGGSGLGTATLSAENMGMAVTGCAFNFNADFLDDNCVVDENGATCTDQAAGEYSVDVSCDDGSLVAEDFVFAIIEDDTVAYTVDVEEPETGGTDGGDSDEGELLITTTDSMGDGLDNCMYDFLALAMDPAPEAPPMGVDCESDDGCSYFAAIEEGSYDVAATCGALSVQGEVNVVAGEQNHAFFVAQADIPDGEFCIGKNGLGIDLDTPVASAQMWLGYGQDGGCSPATDDQYAAMTVVDLSGDDCTDLADPNCAISPLGGAADPQINGEYAHLLWTVLDWTGFADDEKRTFSLTVEDENAEQVVVKIRAKNGYFQ